LNCDQVSVKWQFMEITPLGDSALIIRVVDDFATNPDQALDKVLAVFRQLSGAPIPGVVDLAPAYTTIGVFYNPAEIENVRRDHSPFEALRRKIDSILTTPHREKASKTDIRSTEIPVCYGGELGPDLAGVARACGLDESEVIQRHANAHYRVACVGFVLGFPFLSGLPPELATPRRTTPRKAVPAGSVGIGGAQTGVYPGVSPGGWNLIGRTPMRLFDPQRNPASLLSMGDRVRFRAISREEFDSFAA
jgi:inhibitor of KinA